MYLDPRCYVKSGNGRQSSVQHTFACHQPLWQTPFAVQPMKGSELQVQVYLALICIWDNSSTAAATHRMLRKRDVMQDTCEAWYAEVRLDPDIPKV